MNNQNTNNTNTKNNKESTEGNFTNVDIDDVSIYTATGETGTPFRVSSFTKRTPPRLPNSDTAERSSSISKTSKPQENSESQQQTAKDPAVISSAQESRLCQLSKRLGYEIDSLIQYVEPRKNVHNDIRKMCSIIKKAHTNLITYVEKTEHKARLNSTLVPQREMPPAAANSASVQYRETPPAAARIAPPLSAKRTRARMSPKKPEEQATKSPDTKKRKPDTISEKPAEEWAIVQNKKKAPKGNKKRKPIRPRADAIIIEKTENGMSYADILRAVKTNEQLKDLSDKVKTLRRTQKGDLLIELKKGEKAAANDCCAAIGKALEKVAKVNLRSHNVTIQCRGLIEDLNTDDELLDAIAEQAEVNRPDRTAIKSRRKTGGTESAYVMLPAEEAKKVLALGFIKVGWVRCQVTEVVTPQRCFRCWAYDHVVAKCKGPDRTSLCRRCGEDGHHAASCRKDEKCVLCDGAHKAGSGKCPNYQAAVRKTRA